LRRWLTDPDQVRQRRLSAKSDATTSRRIKPRHPERQDGQGAAESQRLPEQEEQ